MVELKHRHNPKYTHELTVTVALMTGKTSGAIAAKNPVEHAICPTPIIAAVRQFLRNAPKSTSNPAMNSRMSIPTSDIWPNVPVSGSTPRELTITPTAMKAMIVDCLR